MNFKKIKFKNKNGQELSGQLELPINQEPHNFVLFAHCFTCNKNFFAVRNISRSLSRNGFGVLRFDFTGLGESEGDFSDTNFSGNVEDLLAAADYLESEHKAPSLIIGHSLGGAAVIFAAKERPSIKGIITIAAPSSLQHVTHLLKSEISEIQEQGKATVNIGGRSFSIKKQFLDDLQKDSLIKEVSLLRKAILIMHSPQDRIVEIKNAEEIYQAAHHPKSFVSLDGADHLLSEKKDSLYAGEVIAAWALKYIELPLDELPETEHQVVANLGEEGFTTEIQTGNHYLTADEPVNAGGNNFGPTPYQYLSTALASCTSMTLQMYARLKKWDLKNVETHTSYFKKHAEDCRACEKEQSKIDVFEREIVLKGNLDEDQRSKLLEIAEKCPVHRTLVGKISISTRLKKN